MKTWIAGTVALVTMAASALGQGNVIVDFNRDVNAGAQPGNPPDFQDTPMVTLGGVAHYNNPWEVMIAWNTNATPGNETFEVGGIGTIAFDQIPSLPAAEYELLLSMNIANWNNGSPVGIQLGGTGITEVGNELPNAEHYFYPPSNTGQDSILTQIAGPDMGPGSGFMVDSDGTPYMLLTSGGPLPVPTGSNTNIFNDMNSFPTSVIVEPGNQIVLSMRDGSTNNFAHIRGFSLHFIYKAPYFTDFSNVTVNADTDAICFDSIPGGTYALQYSNTVTSATWVNAGASVVAVDTNAYLFDPVEPTGLDPTTTKVYRVIGL